MKRAKDDLISREAAIEKITELISYEWGYEGIENDVRRIFNALPAEVPVAPQWISVDDRLPEDGVKCLMANEEEVRVAWSTGMIRTPEGNIEIPAHYGNGMRVTHWMLLPEPPEGSEK